MAGKTWVLLHASQENFERLKATTVRVPRDTALASRPLSKLVSVTATVANVSGQSVDQDCAYQRSSTSERHFIGNHQWPEKPVEIDCKIPG